MIITGPKSERRSVVFVAWLLWDRSFALTIKHLLSILLMKFYNSSCLFRYRYFLPLFPVVDTILVELLASNISILSLLYFSVWVVGSRGGGEVRRT